MASNSTVLFICPDFFDYKKNITAELSSRYNTVISLSDRPLCSSVSKALIKYNTPIYSSFIAKKYTKDIIHLIENDLQNISDVIIIKGTCIQSSLIDYLKAKNSHIRVVCYSWDSISNIKTFTSLSTKSDKAFTFDLKDSIDFNINYLPLFYMNSNNHVNNLMKSDCSVVNDYFDYTFIGSYHGDRVRVLNQFLSTKINSNNCIKIYFQSYLQYVFFFIHDPYLRACPKEWITFNSLSRGELEETVRHSKSIIDIHHIDQTGLTMRTWETLHAGRRLITTNPAVLLHTTSELATVIDRDSGIEWTTEQCENYRRDVQNSTLDPISPEILPLSFWITTLLEKS